MAGESTPVRQDAGMAATLLSADPAPSSGALPAAALAGLGTRAFGVYVHVPFCTARCGYCDFNTYVGASGDDHAAWAEAAVGEVALARRVLGADAPPAATVFFGGGTPTLLEPRLLARVLRAIDGAFGLEPGAEITIEANPDSVDAAALAELRAAGFTRVSLGMQSAAAHVLAVLERRHTPERPAAAVAEARMAGFAHVALDLIYGTPGETAADWDASLAAVLAAGPDHVSAYALSVEPGTALAARVRRGALPAPDPDVAADRYRAADGALSRAGLRWYEISNWAAGEPARCRHNLGYWRDGDWWGVGPGAHSHVGDVRWWNVLRPASYARRLAGGASPAAGREVLDAQTRRFERVMLGVRLAEGLDRGELTPAGAAAAERLAAAGLLRRAGGRVRLTLEGRLKADAVVRALTD
jgi:putative oxygen-independent coproporphyrinogen III oxidase